MKIHSVASSLGNPNQFPLQQRKRERKGGGSHCFVFYLKFHQLESHCHLKIMYNFCFQEDGVDILYPLSTTKILRHDL